MKTVDITNENALTTDVDTIVDLIKNEQAQEYYDNWKTHENTSVRIALAKKGLFSEIFAKDKECEVRKAVIMGNQSYIPELMKRTIAEWYTCYHILVDMANPNPDVLKAFIEYKHKRCGNDITRKGKRRFRLKYESVTKEPSTLERTMTPYALFIAKNPLWAREISINQITNVEELLEVVIKEGNLDLVEPIFDQILTAENYVEALDIYREEAKNSGRK